MRTLTNRWRKVALGSIVFVLVLEAIGLVRAEPDDTYSEWWWTLYEGRYGVLVAIVTVAFAVWLTVHFLRGRKNRGRQSTGIG